MRPCCCLTLPAFVVLFHARLVRTSSPLSIQSQQAFTTQRACVRDCLYCGEYWELNCAYPPLADAIDCYDDQYDNCYCAPDLQSTASSFITKCINSACSGDQADVSIGMSLYNGYCSIGTWALDTSYKAASPLSIQSQPAFTTQRGCVRDCLYCGEYWLINCAGNPLADAIGCYDDQYDNCYCATDLQSSASSYITRCVNSACSGDQTDVSIAMSLYNGYCNIGTWTLSNYPSATSAPSSLSSSILPGSSIPSVTPVATRTRASSPIGTTSGSQRSTTSGSQRRTASGAQSTPTNGGQSNSSGGLSTASAVGVSVSVICSVLGLIFGIWWKIRETRRAREEAEEARARRR